MQLFGEDRRPEPGSGFDHSQRGAAALSRCLREHSGVWLPGGGTVIYLDSAATTLQKAAGGLPGGAERHGHHDQPRAGDLWSRTGLPHVAGLPGGRRALFQVDQPEQVVLTFNATHGLNLAIHSWSAPGPRCSCRGMSTTPSPVPWPPSRAAPAGGSGADVLPRPFSGGPGAPAEPGGWMW